MKPFAPVCFLLFALALWNTAVGQSTDAANEPRPAQVDATKLLALQNIEQIVISMQSIASIKVHAK